jgi:hypothetical protein
MRTCISALVILLCAQLQVGAAPAGEKLLDVFPESEIIGAQASQGTMAVPGFLATQSALAEVKRRELPFASYLTISVQDAGSTFHVFFSRIPLNSGWTGSPGYPPGLLVRVEKDSYKVLGSYLYPVH